MVTLYSLPAAWGVPSLSPFCMKTDVYLRLAKIEFQTKPGDPRKAPNGKFPYAWIEGEIIGDSGSIEEKLKEVYGDKLDGNLTPEQLALGHLVRRITEESLYWPMVHFRWVDDGGYAAMKGAIGVGIPALVRPVVIPMIRRKIGKALKAQGTGLHDPNKIAAIAKADVHACLTLLGDKPFLFGDEPSSFDGILYSFWAQILATPSENPITPYFKANPTFMGFCERMRARCGYDD